MGKYSVLIAEDQKMPRLLLEHLINKSESFTLAGSVLTAEEAVVFCEKSSVDLVMADVLTGGEINGLDAAEQIKKIRPKTKIIIITGIPDAKWLSRAKQIEADSFLYKETDEDIIEFMERTMKGEHIFPTDTPVVQVGKITNHDFTKHEFEVLRTLSFGDSNAEIAEKIGVSVETVKFHIKEMLRKTGFRSRTELATEARAKGIVTKK